MKFTDLVSIFGQMVEAIWANGKIIRCMVKGYLVGLTEENIQDLI